MKRALVLICVLALPAIMGISILVRSGSRSVDSQTQPILAKVVIPAGTHLTLKLIETILQGSKAGETLEALTAETVFTGGQVAVPANTRVAVHVDNIQHERSGSGIVTVRITELIFSNRSVPVQTTPITTSIQPISDLNMMLRSAGGMIGAAVSAAAGAAGNGVIQGWPSPGTAALEGLAAGSASDEAALVRFQVTSPIDLTGVRW